MTRLLTPCAPAAQIPNIATDPCDGLGARAEAHVRWGPTARAPQPSQADWARERREKPRPDLRH